MFLFRGYNFTKKVPSRIADFTQLRKPASVLLLASFKNDLAHAKILYT